MHANSSLMDQLRELAAALSDAGIRFAAIGGLAVNVYGYTRATRDIDFLVEGGLTRQVAQCMDQLGYEPIDQREDLASFVRKKQRADFLFANRPRSKELLASAADAEKLGIPVVSLEGILAFKIQAFNDDGRRLRDLSDIMELVERNRENLDLEQIRKDFRLFDREELIDDIIKGIDARERDS